MFVGEHNGKLDDKGRIIFPVQLKRQIPEEEQKLSFVLKKDIYEKCLILYTVSEWEYQTNILKSKLNPFNKRHSDFLREYYRGTADLHLDSNNRLLIPKKLLDYIEAEKELVFAGQKGKIEIWAEKNYNSKQIAHEDFADLAHDILGSSFGFYNKE